MSVSAAEGETDALKPVKYVCAACDQTVVLVHGLMQCPHCATPSTSSKIFYKVREEPTEYNTN